MQDAEGLGDGQGQARVFGEVGVEAGVAVAGRIVEGRPQFAPQPVRLQVHHRVGEAVIQQQQPTLLPVALEDVNGLVRDLGQHVSEALPVHRFWSDLKQPVHLAVKRLLQQRGPTVRGDVHPAERSGGDLRLHEVVAFDVDLVGWLVDHGGGLAIPA